MADSKFPKSNYHFRNQPSTASSLLFPSLSFLCLTCDSSVLIVHIVHSWLSCHSVEFFHKGTGPKMTLWSAFTSSKEIYFTLEKLENGREQGSWQCCD